MADAFDNLGAISDEELERHVPEAVDEPEDDRPPSPFTVVNDPVQNAVWDRIMNPYREQQEPPELGDSMSRCGYCGEVIDYCQGHGEDERSEYGFDIGSDEYEHRREMFESLLDPDAVEPVIDPEHNWSDAQSVSFEDVSDEDIESHERFWRDLGDRTS